MIFKSSRAEDPPPSAARNDEFFSDEALDLSVLETFGTGTSKMMQVSIKQRFITLFCSYNRKLFSTVFLLQSFSLLKAGAPQFGESGLKIYRSDILLSIENLFLFRKPVMVCLLIFLEILCFIYNLNTIFYISMSQAMLRIFKNPIKQYENFPVVTFS